MGKVIELWLLLAVLTFARTEENVIPTYFMEGGKLTLDLRPPFTGRITNILWKFSNNLLAEWVENIDSLDFYGTFKDRTTLDTKTGRLEIDKMTKNDTGVYSVEINSKVQSQSYKGIAIKKVPQPVIEKTCTKESDSCILTCTGDTTEAEPVTYSWETGDGQLSVSARVITINKTEHSHVETFTCRMKNPLSKKDSEPLENPLYQSNTPTVIGSVFGALALLLAGAGVFGAWKLKKGPFKDGTASAPDRTDQPPSNAAETVGLADKPDQPPSNAAETVGLADKPDQPPSNAVETVGLADKSADSRDDGGDPAGS